ncbi:NADH-dependent [FeFe] hydrogenase, group A6 [Pseudoduganella ginsengisoli]|uniref:2Fe-2S iron-sulfur cluster binding domain-containing protein n=1 Tax=Pseudoduganella ginsengisoli TaxID=1462440 RepID=A0A6L6Q564_9BURK|nr:[FeFe] hydrogenase, group A [Pseudoduganella ginsengisoli]MTW04609.1 2Fe-2S iron-sulfur cluster binding domain-containing protein [Pseudoduganella ginsengisoli]
MIRLTINGRTVEVSDGATFLDAAREAGVYIPTLCFHPRLPSHAVCRMCLVQVAGQAHPQPACITKASEGDVVTTDAEELRQFRAMDAQWLLARHPNDCMHCEVNGACRLQNLVSENQWEDRWEKLARGTERHPEHRLTDHTSPSIWRDLSKCVECGLCVEACGASGQGQYVIGFAERGTGRLPVTVFDQPLANTQCISCGQCTSACPVGALVETPHWHDVLHTLDGRRRVTAVQVAPATRIAIGEEFGMAPGTVSTGKMIHALRRLGFDYIFDSNFGADLTIMEEATELLGRLAAPSRHRLPLFTSCCPGWVNWVEINRPDLLPHLSTAKSPQQMHGALTKRSAFARTLGPGFSSGCEEPYVVSVMPCTAKKDEAVRPGMAGDLDHAVTTRELARMIKARGIAFHALPDDGAFDQPLGASTGAAQIFAASGGVMEAMVRTAAHFAGVEESLPLEWQPLRGVTQGVKTAQIPGLGKVAICNGIATAQRLLETETWRDEFIAIEVMACVGGCLGGGGEPKSMDPQVLEKRMQAVYSIDKQAPRRRSYENPDVQALYAEELEAPNSVQAHALLHTSYAARNSSRLLLMRFLDCVDRRDGSSAARLCHPDVVWQTASRHGDLHGALQIQAFIDTQLPPRRYGPAFLRHTMASAADPEDLTVITPAGERCAFHVEAELAPADGIPAMLIKRLVRIPGHTSIA